MILRFLGRKSLFVSILCVFSVLFCRCGIATGTSSVVGAESRPWLTHDGQRSGGALQLPPVQGRSHQQTPLSTEENAGYLDRGARIPPNGPRLTYSALLEALDVMESHFFQVSHGTWPSAIDWTAAVMGTHVSATLAAMAEHIQPKESIPPTPIEEARDQENLINRYFTQITSFYFGENAFSLRTQAYDDMLWVVLGWLESIKFINLHSNLWLPPSSPSDDHDQHNSHNLTWYGGQFIPQYAHRARLFYDLASRGWDTTLCGGGMIWSPYLAPYKNAITNQLFITASVGMYLYFPGDSNASPFEAGVMGLGKGLPPAKAHDDRYLNNAIEGYEWLKNSGMRNEKGLYVDGFHINGWRGGRNGSNGTQNCDVRDEMVYTYNQGVLLSGLRGLWEATGSRDYLLDAHSLVRSVIDATGWDNRDTGLKWRWAGLGRNGVLEESCDWSGTCSQDGQTFKGIFFHHLTLFCSPLPHEKGRKDKPWLGDEDIATLHQQSCDGYGEWIAHNAHAASVTRDESGEFGTWWGRPFRLRHEDEAQDGDDKRLESPTIEGTDYRNQGIPRNKIWRLPDNDDALRDGPDEQRWVQPLGVPVAAEDGPLSHQRDINDRGRGRTVETQSGGVAVLRATWRLVDFRKSRSD